MKSYNLTLKAKGSQIPIFFIGPIAPTGSVPKGGYEAANRRTIDNLKKIKALKINELPYPIAQGSKISKLLSYGFGFLKLLNTLIKNIFHNRNPYSPVCHITGLYKQFIYIEVIVVFIAKLLRTKVIYEIRAGSMLHHYYSRSEIYRTVFRTVLMLSDNVGVEGLENRSFVKKYCKKDPVYMPNYVNETCPFETIETRNRQLKDNINLVYFGRVDKNKGVKTIIDCYHMLHAADNRFNLEIIGEPSSIDYSKKLNSLIQNNDNITISKSMPQETLFAKLQEKHFFLFPTMHTGEGHSNALTEAMANGCVPICSDAGFNKSVVGACGVIFPMQSGAELYKDAVIGIINQGWDKFAADAVLRVQKNYHRSMIIDNYYHLYKN